jgi:DNA-binding transcriptional LysR family regulator
MRLNHRQVEAFRAVFQTGSMTAAGALMGVTQPAVSRLVRDFEAEIKIPLFDRKGGRISATPMPSRSIRRFSAASMGSIAWPAPPLSLGGAAAASYGSRPR